MLVKIIDDKSINLPLILVAVLEALGMQNSVIVLESSKRSQLPFRLEALQA